MHICVEVILKNLSREPAGRRHIGALHKKESEGHRDGWTRQRTDVADTTLVCRPVAT
jgi:hypothetical protein